MTRVEQDKVDGPDPSGGYRHPDPVTDEALTWFAALQDGVPDAGTLAAFQDWRRSDPRRAAAFDRLAEIAGMPELRAATLASPSAPAVRPPAPAPAPLPPPVSLPKPRRAPRRRRWVAWVAASAALVAAGLHLYPAAALRWAADHWTAAGERREFPLPDGSRLLLGGGSAVALDFAEGRRLVRLLRGEGFFEVVPDAAHPFRVVAAHSTVQVTGTAFAVRSGEREDAVVLERGRVSVTGSAQPDQSLALAPGERVTATDDGLSVAVRVDSASALAWREGRFIFHDQPLGTVVETLRRYHDGTILLLGRRIGEERVSGNFRLDDPVGALRSLAQIAGARMAVLPAGVIVIG